MGDSEGRIKGSGIQPFLVWYAATWGEERIAEIGRRIPPAHLKHLRLDEPLFGVLPSAWYPAAPIHALLDAIQAIHTREERALIVRDGARAIIDSTLTGVYRWLFEKMMTTERYASSAQRLFSRYYEPGTMSKVRLGETGHLTVVTGWGAHHPMLCEFIIHTAEYVYGAMGCKNFQARRITCVLDGSPDCRFEMTWS
jgi:hypothetical protein